MGMTRTPTMRDVASLAGVSIQTVSHVVNQTGSISAETRDRVLNAIESLNYRRNPIARSMRTRQTRLIGLLVLDITNPVLSTIASEVEAAAYASEYSVLLYNVRHDPERERESLETFAERLVDGVIVVNAMDREHTFSWLESGTIPTVLIDCLSTSSLPSVAVDNEQGAQMATEHLIALGHRHITHLSGAMSLEVARQRVRGYERAMAAAGLTGQQRIVTPINNRWDYQSGYLSMKSILEGDVIQRPTAIFAAGDQMAIGALRALAEAGLRVPDDMSVVGFDDIEAASFITPQLTTIRQPLSEIASRAFALLLDLLESRHHKGQRQVTLPAQLMIRGSTSAPGGRS
jgi:DNA-binding LacI/PurR family transcriptional regulator